MSETGTVPGTTADAAVSMQEELNTLKKTNQEQLDLLKAQGFNSVDEALADRTSKLERVAALESIVDRQGNELGDLRKQTEGTTPPGTDSTTVQATAATQPPPATQESQEQKGPDPKEVIKSVTVDEKKALDELLKTYDEPTKREIVSSDEMRADFIRAYRDQAPAPVTTMFIEDQQQAQVNEAKGTKISELVRAGLAAKQAMPAAMRATGMYSQLMPLPIPSDQPVLPEGYTPAIANSGGVIAELKKVGAIDAVTVTPAPQGPNGST